MPRTGGPCELVIEYAEERVFASRSGKGGAVQEDVRGVVAAAFDHWDSRAGDPQLHTHVVVMNRVQTLDGVWRTIDSKALFRWTVGLSELYQGVLSDCLTEALGWGWEPRERAHSPVPKWEVAGVPQALMDEFSQRSSVIEQAKDVMVAEFVASHGRQPTAREVIRMRQQATLETRPEKNIKPLAELVAGWRARAEPFIGTEQTDVGGRAGRAATPVPPLRSDVIGRRDARRGRPSLALGGRRRAPGHVHPTQRVCRGAAPAARGPVRRTGRADRGRGAGDRPGDGAGAAAHPTRRRGAARSGCGARTGRPGCGPGTARSTPRLEILDAETRLVDAGRRHRRPRASTRAVAQAACAAPLDETGRVLSADQAAAVVQVVTSGRPLDVLVGPAGSGKSTAMAGVRAAWEAHHGPGSVVGLAPSAAAAEVLADAVGIPTENTAKWLTEQHRQAERQATLDALSARLLRASPTLTTRRLLQQARSVAAEIDRWQLRPGQLVIVDEASMAGTLDLDTITTHAQQAGAKVLLVGDWAQLSPVSAGGAFHLLAHDRDDVATLHEIRRFAHPWERDASVRLRDGDPAVVDEYIAHGRVEGGDRESMLDLLYEAWRTRHRAGLDLADDRRRHRDRPRPQPPRPSRPHPRRRRPTAEGVRLADGTTAGVGDVIVTRRNDRRLAAPGGLSRTATAGRPRPPAMTAAMTVQRPSGGAPVRLPAAYVAAARRARLRHHRTTRPGPHRRPRPRLRLAHRRPGRRSTSWPPAECRATPLCRHQPRPRPRLRPRRPARDRTPRRPPRGPGPRRGRPVRIHRARPGMG